MKRPGIPVMSYLNKSWNSLVGVNAKQRIHQLEVQLTAANKKIEQQAKDLKKVNDDIEQLAYIVSHDLKAPARNIRSFMKLLLSKFGNSFTDDAREFMEHSLVSSERLAKQIDDLIFYCRVDRNLPPASSIDLEQMLKTIQAELSGKINQCNASITIEQHLPTLHQVHSGMIHDIFLNLIDNALKFNTSERPEVHISCKEEDDEFTFSVSDNGIGISPEYKSKLFQMFRRLHSADQFEGTGIGLAVCKKIVNLYNGNIWFNSEPGRGTTFCFTIPKAIDSSATHLSPQVSYQHSPFLKAA